MELTYLQYIIVCPLVFLAGFADSIAGGGGILSLPAYSLAGVPLILAYGTNKFAMSLGTSISAYQYYKGGHIRFQSAAFAIPGALFGSYLGAQLAMLLDERILAYCMMILLPFVAVFLTLNKNFFKTQSATPVSRIRERALGLCIGFFVGMYDGFFGPGAGTFYTMLFALLLHYGLLSASGNARIINLASNIGALTGYILSCNVLYALGIPAALCAILGNYTGARMAIKNGARFIRPVMVCVIALLFVKIISDTLLA